MVISKDEFIARMAQNGNTSKRASKKYLNLMLDTFFECLKEEETILFHGLFKAEVTKAREKETYNIATGERMVLPAHKCFKVRISKSLQEKFNNADVNTEDEEDSF